MRRRPGTVTVTVMNWTVPAAVADLAVDAGLLSAEQAVQCGRTVGERVELDLGLLHSSNPDAARWCGQYWDTCQRFWDDLADGHRDGAWVMTERTLVDVAQRDSSDHGRQDLRDELAALETIGPLAAIVDAVCGADVDETTLNIHTSDWTRDGAVTTVRCRLDRQGLWPAALGGMPSSGEIARIVTLTVRHAAWRDRKVRRLVAVHVAAVELWPDPAAV